jgi:hypothetical protein
MPFIRITLIIFLFAFTKSFSQDAGFFGTPLSSIIYNAGSAQDQEANNFDGSNLGLISNLELSGARISTFKNNGADVTGAFIHYRVYEQSSVPPSFTEQSISFAENLGGGDQRWEQSGLNIDLLSGLPGGDYTLEVYFRITKDCCSGQVFQNNSGANYSADFSIPYRTTNDGNWDVSGTWIGGSIPPPDVNVAILNTVTLNTDATVSSITIENAVTFTGSDASNRTLSISDGGIITNNGTLTGGSNGTVNFLGVATVNGSNSRTFNNVELNGGVDFGATPETSTINGTLTINASGFVSANSPIYGNDSTLIYQTNNNYGRRSEWSNAGIQGSPHDVILRNNTILNMGSDNAINDAVISGNLSIENDSVLDIGESDPMQGDINIEGNLQNDGIINASDNISGVGGSDIRVFGDFTNNPDGTVNLSSLPGNDFHIEGDFTNQGTFNFNSRAVFFEGNQTQNLTAQNHFDIPFLIIDKTAGEVVLQQDIILSGSGGPVLNMSDESILNLNDNQLQIGNNTDSEISMTGNSVLVGSVDSRILFNSTSTAASPLNILRFSQNATDQENYLSEFEMEGIGTVGISNTLNILRQFILRDGTFNSDGHLTFKSSDILTAVIPEVINGSISGDVRVERHFPLSNRAFRYISSSVTSTTSIHENWQEGALDATTPDPYTDSDFNPNPGFGTHITGAPGSIGGVSSEGLDYTQSGNRSLYEFDETNQTDPWGNGITSTNDPLDIITAGKPYALMVRGDRSAPLNSNTAQGSSPTTLRTTGAVLTGGQIFNSTISSGEFTLVGNPYQAQVNMNTILSNSTGFNPDYMWIWDPNMGTLGGYAIVDLSNGNQVDELFNQVMPRTSQANQYLQPFQACMLQANGNSPSLTFVEIAKRNDGNESTNIGTFSENTTSSNVLDIELYRSNTQTLYDAIKLRFSTNYSTSPSFEDAVKLWNNTERLAIINNTSYLSIDKRNLPQTNDTIPLYLGNYQDNQYTLKLESSLSDDINAYFYDHYLDQTTAISNGINTYDFSIDQNIPESLDNQRFELIFNPLTLGLDEPTLDDNFKVYPNPTQGLIYLQIHTAFWGNDAQIYAYDVTGREVFNQNHPNLNAQNSIDLNALSPSFYLLKLETDGLTKTFKVQVK